VDCPWCTARGFSFIFHAVRSWLKPVADPFAEQIRAALEDSEWAGRLAEASVATHFRRHFPTYYLKAEGEVDVAVVHEGRFWPIEVKWTGQLRPKDLKPIRKYRNGVVWGQTRTRGSIEGVPVEPLPLALARLTGEEQTLDQPPESSQEDPHHRRSSS